MADGPPRVKLLSDAPVCDDPERLHGKVADAITELILGESEEGKAIALIGTWGSGKSTVVELVRA